LSGYRGVYPGKWIISEQGTAGRGKAQRRDPPLHETKPQGRGTRHFRALAFPESIPELMRLRAVNCFVAGPQCPDDCATNDAKSCADPGSLGPTHSCKDIARAARYRRPDPRSCAGTGRRPDESVAQTVCVFHELHAANLLPLDRLRAPFLL
jgi:hypothetical protein